MENKRLEFLLGKYLSATMTPEEETELFQMLDENRYDEAVKNYLQQSWSSASTGYELNEHSSKKIWSSIIGEQATKPVAAARSFNLKWWLAAAAILILGGFGIYSLVNRSPAIHAPLAVQHSPKKFINDVPAGTNGAILKLADGSSIVLDSVANGTVSTQGNMKVVKDGAMLNYVQLNDPSLAAGGFNTIETPNGRQFSLMLGDGTKVWLNAASSIHFPVAFTGNERRVEITGEAYFEVAKNKEKPFRVSVNGSEVEVLGTHFNINSYNDESTMNTTLLEGSVKVTHAGNNTMLVPGQQAQVNEKGAIAKLNHINTNEVVAWKNNAFSFNNTDLKKLMRQLSRWYDVEIIYKNEHMDPVKFNGEISRSVSLSNVLKMLELTGEVNFAIEGKKIIVST